MELSFSQRMGFKPVKSVIQVDRMDDELRTALWNVLTNKVWSNTTIEYSFSNDYMLRKDFTDNIWVNFLKKTEDTRPEEKLDFLKVMKTQFFKFEWYMVYDFLEFVANRCGNKTVSRIFIQACNVVLERELSAYRFIGTYLTPVTSDNEIEAVEKALSISSSYTQHLSQALELLSNKKSPDYRNSIKESISAVEAMCQLITGDKKATLGDTLRKLESKLGILHGAQKDAFTKLYGYTSDAHGIRHALLGESDLRAEDAIYMLVVCSAFINYLVAKANKAGIKLPRK